MFKKKHHQKALLVASIVGLGLLLGHQAMQLKELMHKRRHNMLQDKIEHFQHCFERLLEHR